MSNADVLKSLKQGDIVKATRTLRIMDDRGDKVHWGEDVAEPRRFYLLDDSPSLKIEMVKKVAKQRTDYKVGDVVSGDELRATQWKRGTIVAHEDIRILARFILQRNGRWVSIEDIGWPKAVDFGFEDFQCSGYTIKYLPD